MRSLLGLLGVLAITLAAHAGDWPQFQGPDRNGISPEKGLAKTWPQEGPKVLWTAKMLPGFGGAAVEGDRLYILDNDGKQDILHCLKTADGTEDWSFKQDGAGRTGYPGSRSTPLLDKDHVYFVGPFGQLTCVSKKTHEKVWTRNLVTDKEFESRRPQWAIAQSPCLYKDLVIVAPQSSTVGVAALNRKTGEKVWYSKPIGPMAYQSPYVTKLHGVEQVIMMSNTTLAGLDVKDGTILWSYEGFRCRIPIASPTDLGDGRFFITAAYNSGCAMVQVTLDGKEWKVKELFKNRNVESWMHNALYYDKHLFANSTTNRKGLLCLDTEGKIAWASEKGFDIGGPLLIADGMIYIMEGNGGTLHMVKASADKYQNVASAKILDGEQIWAPMALSDGKLYCRDQKQLKCVDLKGK